MKVKEIVSRVRAAIDELTENEGALIEEPEDEQNLTKIIIDKIGYALQWVIESAPLERLDSSVFEGLSSSEAAGFSIDGVTLVGRLKLPSDLLHIVEARLSSWTHYPKPLPDTSPEALMQVDEYARGSWDRPVNIVTYDGGDKYLEMYCARTSDDTLKFTFVRKPKHHDFDENDMEEDVAVPTLLEASLIYQVAGLTMTAFREELAGPLFAISLRYLDPRTAAVPQSTGRDD